MWLWRHNPKTNKYCPVGELHFIAVEVLLRTWSTGKHLIRMVRNTVPSLLVVKEASKGILRRLHPAYMVDTWELLCVACCFYRLLVRVVEDLLVGGEDGDPPGDLRGCVLVFFFFKSRVPVYLISVVNSLVSWWFWVRTPVCPPADSLTAKTNKMLANKAPPGLEQEYGIDLVN